MLNNFKKLTTFFAFAAFLLGISLNVYAQQPDAPYNLNAEVVYKSDGRAVVSLKWQYSSNNNSDMVYFNIYMAYGKTEDRTQFKKIAYTKSQSSHEYGFTVEQLSSGWYSFYVTAVRYVNNQQTESGQSNIAMVEVQGSNDNPFVRILSQYPPYAQVNVEYKYQVKAYSNIRCPILYELIGEAPEGMAIDKSTGLLTWTPTQEGIFTGAIKAYLECDETVYAIQQFSIKVGQHNEKPYIKIVSQPNLKAEAGKEWIYEIKAESNANCPILFKWAIGNTNQNTIIEGTGNIIKWIPESNGYYYLVITAYLECDHNVSITQTFKIIVGGDDNPDLCAVITGSIYYEDGNPVMEGVVTAWMIVDYTNSAIKPMFKAEIRQGTFSMKVLKGEYLLQFIGQTFETEWFENAADMHNAKSITVNCNDTYSLNAHVKKYHEPNHHQVSGRVTGEDNGEPVMAVVYFSPVKWKEDSRKYPPDNSNAAFMAKTDQDGYYAIKLPDNFTYTAQAVPVEKNSGYLPQYYDRVDHPMEADIIVVEGDVEGIDFILKKRQQYENGFAGIVKNEDGNGIKSRVIAYLVSSNTNYQYNYILSTETDSNGNFYFKNLIPGDYVLLSIPMERKYVPGYYKQGDFVTQKWRQATRIAVSEAMIDVVFELKHRVLNVKEGNIRIKGRVSEEFRIFKNGEDQSLSSEAIAGVFIYLTDNYGNVIEYTFSDNTGAFELFGFDAGSYNLNSDKVGYDTYSQKVETDYKSNFDIETNIVVIKSVSGLDDETSVDGLSIFPQPATNFININYPVTSGSVSFNIYNAVGLIVGSYSTAADQNGQSYQISTASLSAGVYYLTIVSGMQKATAMFTVLR